MLQNIATMQGAPPNAKDFIKPSKQFKNKVANSLFAIVLFFITYILLLAASVGLAVGFGLLAIVLIRAYAHWVTIAIGLALVMTALFLIYFLVKFVFKKSEATEPGYEIFEQDQPELFAFIREVTVQTNVPFPKHIYIIPQVNASVFYDSHFLSMFLPVKKNLNIGLGLVNCLNRGEFRSVLAHEFGHFSQLSMKLGSYVNHVNIMIDNMLNDNDSYANVLDSFGSIHSFFKITVLLNVKIIKGIQFILQKLQIYINKTRLGLSRQMEFHADAIAAVTTGANNTITSSRRIDIGEIGYQNAINYWNGKLSNKQKPVNIYPIQSEYIRSFSKNHQIPMDADGLPYAGHFIEALNPQKITVGAEWSTHPSSLERENALLNIPFDAPVDTQSTWTLFNNAEALQQYFTNDLYSSVDDVATFSNVELTEFKTDFDAIAANNNYNDEYKGYYDARIITEFNINEVLNDIDSYPQQTIDDLLTNDNCVLSRQIGYLMRDISTLLLATDGHGEADIRFFDFNGKAYPVAEAPAVNNLLKKERDDKKAKLDKLDIELFVCVYRKTNSAEERDHLTSSYGQLFAMQRFDEAGYDIYNRVHAALSPLYQTMPFDKITEAVKDLKAVEEPFKTVLAEVLADDSFAPFINEEMHTALTAYENSPAVYFANKTYKNDELDMLINAVNSFYELLVERTFKYKQNLFAWQLSIANR